MRNLHKLLIVLISVAFMASGAMAQISEISPGLIDQSKQKVKPASPYSSYLSEGLAQAFQNSDVPIVGVTENEVATKEFSEDQLKQLNQLGFDENDLGTAEGIANAEKLLSSNMVYSPSSNLSTFNSNAIKNTDESVTITVGIETNVSTGSNDTPFGTYWHDGQNQYLFEATELAIAGLGAGDMTEIGWNVVVADAAVMAGFNIEVKHTDATSVTGFETDFTNVYSADYTAVVGWNMFTFSSPFVYDGTSNLLIKVCFDNDGYTANSSVYYSNTALEMNGWAYNDGTAGCSDPWEGSMLNRPNTRITGEENLSAPPAFPFNEMPISGTFDVPVDGDLTWEMGSTETYDLWFGMAGAMELVVEAGNGTSGSGVYSYTGLDYASTYEWQVIAYNANGQTDGAVWNFVSACAVFAAPYYEDFTTWPPVCWDLTGGTNEWVQYTTGVECAEASFWGQSAGSTDYMTSAAIDIAGGNYGLEFFWSHTFNTSYPDDALEVLVSDDGGATWTQVWYKIGTELESNDGATSTAPGTFVSSDIISLGAFGDEIKLQFIGWSGFGPDLFIDDISVFDVAYGDLDGTIKELATNNPIEGAVVTIDGMTGITGGDGTYSITGVLVGDYDVTVTADGFNPATASVTILDGITTTQDFTMTAPTMDIEPLAINVTVDPNGQLTENIDITNNGDGSLGWNAQLELLTDGTDEIGDILLELNVSTPAAETQMLGGEWDGTYFWTTGAGSGADPNKLYKFDVDGNLLETYDQPAASTAWGVRDLAWDGTYLYGGNETQFYQIDPADGTFTLLFNQTWGTIRALAWVPSEDAFYTKSFGDPLQKFDISGTLLEETTVPEAAAAYGAAWDDMNNMLYIFDQSGSPLTTFVEFDINAGAATGVTYQIPLIAGSTDQTAGGAFFATDLIPGKAVLGGVTQGTPDDIIFAMELGEASGNWISIDPNSGDVDPGSFSAMDVNFDATDLIAGTTKTANINFSSTPDVGMVTVPVSMTVGNLEFAYIEGNVMLDGDATYNIGDVEEVEVMAGAYMTYPDVDGDYMIEVYPGTYDVTTTLYGYETQSTEVIVAEGATVSDVDFVMPTTYGRVMGTVTDAETGDPISGAMVMVIDTDFFTETAVDGTYEIFIEAGTYDIYANHDVYTPQTVEAEIMVEMDTELDFELEFSLACEFSVVLTDDYGDGWNGNTLTISVDGVPVLENIAIATGAGPETWYFETATGSEVLCEYTGTAAQWDYENEYHIFDNDNEEVFADGVGGVPPVGGSFTSACIVFIYGDLSGTVTELETGNPVEGAVIMVDDMEGVTIADGSYFIESVMVGTWDATCNAMGYNVAMEPVEIFEEMLTEQDFELTAPTIDVDPMSISITLEPNAMADEMVTIGNNGNGPLDWSASVNVLADNTDEVGDILLELNVSTPAAETQMLGGEWDGTYFWTTGAGSGADPNKLYKFDVDGNLLETYDQPAASTAWGVRDLAWDGTYLYGGNETQFYQIDPADGTFTLLFNQTWGTIRALAWVPSEDAFYTKSFGDPLQKFDISGTLLEETTVPEAAAAYGAAWDDMNNMLYIFDQSGSPLTTFIEYDIEAGAATGVSYQIPLLAGSTDQTAGGAFFATDLIPGKAVLGGVTQGTPDDIIFAMELGEAFSWITIDPSGGMLEPETDEEMTVHFDATELLPGVYEAEIQFGTTPDVGSPVIIVTMTVEGLIPAVELMADYTCTDVELMWEMPTGGDPDSWDVYRDDELIGSADAMTYTDMMVMPEMEYTYTVVAVYGSEEAQPSSPAMITVPVPADLDPYDAEAMTDTPNENEVTLIWEVPEACVAPDSYSVYKNGEMIADGIMVAEYVDGPMNGGVYEYYVVAVYYFGESDASNAAYAVITGIEDYDASLFQIYPNPAAEMVNVKSPVSIDRVLILNSNGQLVLDEEVNSMEYQINVSNYDAGFYFIKLETSEGVILRKVAVK